MDEIISPRSIWRQGGTKFTIANRKASRQSGQLSRRGSSNANRKISEASEARRSPSPSQFSSTSRPVPRLPRRRGHRQERRHHHLHPQLQCSSSGSNNLHVARGVSSSSISSQEASNLQEVSSRSPGLKECRGLSAAADHRSGTPFSFIFYLFEACTTQ